MAFDWNKHITKPSQQARMSFALLYGPPGGGKTYTAATAARVKDLCPVLIIDTEGSTVGSLVGFSDVDDQIDILPVTTHEGFEAVMAALDAGELPRKYKTVIIDTFDVAQDRAEEYFDETAPLTNSGQKDTFAKWRLLKEWALDVGDKFRSSDYLGIIVTHSKRNVDEGSGKVTVDINLVGSAKDVLPGLPDIVAYIDRDGEVTTAHFEASRSRVSKNRHGLPATMEDPSFAKIAQIVSKKPATTNAKEK